MGKKGRRLSKEEEVALLHDRFSKSESAYFVDYRGLDVAEISDLRERLRESETEFRVVKNTLAKRAAEGTPYEVVEDHFSGPTAVVVPADDPVKPANVLVEFIDEVGELEIKAGVMRGGLLDVDGVKAVAALPAREELLGKLLNAFDSVPGGLVRLLAQVPKSFVQLLKSRQEALQD